jgi:hypothetical protein
MGGTSKTKLCTLTGYDFSSTTPGNVPGGDGSIGFQLSNETNKPTLSVEWTTGGAAAVLFPRKMMTGIGM